MQQRVGLARAYATTAPVLPMDEPFSALDPLIRTHLQDELLDHQKKLDCSILFVSHDLEEAFKLGHRIAIMDEGRIVQIGTPHQIFKSALYRLCSAVCGPDQPAAGSHSRRYTGAQYADDTAECGCPQPAS